MRTLAFLHISGLLPHRVQFLYKFIPVTALLIGLARFRCEVTLAGDGRVLQMLRPTAQLARNLFGKRFQISDLRSVNAAMRSMTQSIERTSPAEPRAMRNVRSSGVVP